MKKFFKQTLYGEWKPYASNKLSIGIFDFILIIGLILIIGCFAWYVHSQTIYMWKWSLLFDFIITKNTYGQWVPGLLISGLIVTIKLGLWSILLAFIIGLCIGIPSAHKKGFSTLPFWLYINTLRNIPPLVLLFFLYFFIGTIIPIVEIEKAIQTSPNFIQKGIAFCFAPINQTDRMLTAIITLGIYEGAYVAEIVRASIESVPYEQWETSSALGFSKYIQLKYIILPQAFTYMLPLLVGQSISIFKESALASLISLPELTFQSLETMTISQMTFETWISTAFLYLLLGLICSWVGYYLKQRNTYTK